MFWTVHVSLSCLIQIILGLRDESYSLWKNRWEKSYIMFLRAQFRNQQFIVLSRWQGHKWRNLLRDKGYVDSRAKRKKGIQSDFNLSWDWEANSLTAREKN